MQWDNLSKELQANIRVDWIHTPGSDLFLVYGTGYITDDTRDPRLDSRTPRTAVAKRTWLKLSELRPAPGDTDHRSAPRRVGTGTPDLWSARAGARNQGR